MKTATEIEVTYNDDHTADASREIDGRDYTVRCNGLSSCGETFCDGENPWEQYEDGEPDERWEAFQELRTAAIGKVKSEWNYDGSNWSEPVDDPEIELADEADEDHPIQVSRTEFHGGAIIGYAESQEDADAWIAHASQGTDCVCGCYQTSDDSYE